MAGGLKQERFLMQIYADVTAPPGLAVGSEQGPALGSAIHAAVAAGAYPDVPAAAEAMGAVEPPRLRPRPGARRRLRRALRGVPCACTTTSGAAEGALHRLRRIRNAALASGPGTAEKGRAQ